MQELLQIALLAIIQGLTEFLPVSSSGHLVIIGHFIEFQEQGNMTEVLLHIGTLAAVLVYFKKRLRSLASGLIDKDPASRQFVTALAAGSIPIVIMYLAAGRLVETLFDKPIWSAIFLCVTGVLLLSLLLKRSTGLDVNAKRGFFIGIAQALALLPGISRSGTTIVAARHLGLSPEKAAEFSFLLYLPAMAGAIAVKTIEVIRGAEAVAVPKAFIGITLSAVVGYAALALLIRIVKRSRLWFFGIYCLLAGIISILLLISRP